MLFDEYIAPPPLTRTLAIPRWQVAHYRQSAERREPVATTAIEVDGAWRDVNWFVLSIKERANLFRPFDEDVDVELLGSLAPTNEGEKST